MSAPPPEARLLPVFLKLEGLRVVLVGGGKVAGQKLEQLLSAGARVTVVAPEVLPELERPGVEVLRRPFEPRDLDGAWLAAAAAPPEVNRAVAAAAEARRIFLNAADDPAAASAYLGGVLRRGGVTIAVSTGGRSPALAGLIREGLEALLPAGDVAEAWLERAGALRARWRAEGTPMKERRPMLLEALLRLHARDA